MRRGLPIGLVALAIVAWAWPLQHVAFWTRRDNLGDVRIFEGYARAMASGAVPYRDLRIEYPPGATLLFWLTWHLPGDFRAALSAFMLVCLCICVLGVVATARALGLSDVRQAVAGGVVALSPLLLGPIVVERFDMAVAAAMAWMLWAAVAGRWRTMWVLLGVGVLIKLIPIALLPLLVIWHAHRRGWPAAVRGGAIGLAVVAVLAVPVALLSPSGTWYYLAYNLRRPPQLESMPATVFLVAHAVAGTSVSVVDSFHSDGIRGAGPAALATAMTVALVLLVVGCAARCWRLLTQSGAPVDADLLMQGVATTVVALTVAGKVLSPQYMIWLLPVVVLVPGATGRVGTAMLVALLLITESYFPLRYQELVLLHTTEITILTLRNALLVGLLVLCWPRAARTGAGAARTHAGGAHTGRLVPTPGQRA